MLIECLELDTRRQELKRSKAQAARNQQMASVFKRHPLLATDPKHLALMLQTKEREEA